MSAPSPGARAGAEDLAFDRPLFAALAAGDITRTKVADLLYRRYAGRLTAIVVRRCGGDRDWAADVCQTAWARAMTTLSSYRCDDRSYMAYLRVVATNIYADICKSAAHQRCRPMDPVPLLPTEGSDDRNPLFVLDTHIAPSPSAEECVLDRHISAAIGRILAALDEECGTPEQAEAARLHYLEGLSVREISLRLGLEEGAVKARTARARRALRRSDTIRRIYRDAYDREPV